MNDKSLDAQSFVAGKPPDPAIKSFFVYGSEQFLMDKVILFLRKILIARHNAEVVVLYGNELKAAEFRDYLDSYSYFAETKILFIKNADQMKADTIQPLVDYFASPADDQILVISAVSVDSRLTAWKTVMANSLTIKCDPPKYQSHLGQWLDSELRALKKTMSPDARQEFLERVELDYKSADNEMQKILILIGDHHRIELKDINTSLGSSRTKFIGDLYKALHTNQSGKVMEVIQNILDTGGDAIPTLASILKYYLILWRIALLKRKKLSTAEIQKSHLNDIYDSYREPYIRASENYPLVRFEKVFTVLLETDSQLKLTAADPKTLLTNCISRIMIQDEK